MWRTVRHLYLLFWVEKKNNLKKKNQTGNKILVWIQILWEPWICLHATEGPNLLNRSLHQNGVIDKSLSFRRKSVSNLSLSFPSTGSTWSQGHAGDWYNSTRDNDLYSILYKNGYDQCNHWPNSLCHVTASNDRFFLQ